MVMEVPRSMPHPPRMSPSLFAKSWSLLPARPSTRRSGSSS